MQGSLNSHRILVVEDQADLARALLDNLELEGYRVACCASGTQAVVRILDSGPDLVILDIMLPDLDGFRVLQKVRKAGFDGAVLMLTARSEETDKVRGLRWGADDYLTKPFGLLELLARVSALLRRVQPATAQNIRRLGDIELNIEQRVVRRLGQDVALAPKEFELFLALLRHEGAVVSRAQLLSEVWGHSGRVETRTVDTHVAELRRKLERDPSAPEHLLTSRKAGYRWVV